MTYVRHLLTLFGVWTAHPAAFLIVMIYAVLWAIFAPERLDWHGVATLATWVMTLFIQRAEHRDTQAIHAKLDELLHVHGKASHALTRLDDKSRRTSSATASRREPATSRAVCRPKSPPELTRRLGSISLYCSTRLPRQERAAKLFCQPDSYAMDAEDLRTYREAMAAGPLRALLGGYARLARAAR